MHRLSRRQFIAYSSLLLPSLATMLGGCARDDHWPAGMKPILWERDTCVRCNMQIADHRFALQMRGGARDTVFNFDDVGCLVVWLERQHERFPWMNAAETRIWVADFNSPSRKEIHWLDPRTSRYVQRRSPMGYNFVATANTDNETSVDYAEMRQHILAMGR